MVHFLTLNKMGNLSSLLWNELHTAGISVLLSSVKSFFQKIQLKITFLTDNSCRLIKMRLLRVLSLKRPCVASSNVLRLKHNHFFPIESSFQVSYTVLRPIYTQALDFLSGLPNPKCLGVIKGEGGYIILIFSYYFIVLVKKL